MLELLTKREAIEWLKKSGIIRNEKEIATLLRNLSSKIIGGRKGFRKSALEHKVAVVKSLPISKVIDWITSSFDLYYEYSHSIIADAVSDLEIKYTAMEPRRIIARDCVMVAEYLLSEKTEFRWSKRNIRAFLILWYEYLGLPLQYDSLIKDPTGKEVFEASKKEFAGGYKEVLDTTAKLPDYNEVRPKRRLMKGRVPINVVQPSMERLIKKFRTQKLLFHYFKRFKKEIEVEDRGLERYLYGKSKTAPETLVEKIRITEKRIEKGNIYPYYLVINMKELNSLIKEVIDIYNFESGVAVCRYLAEKLKRNLETILSYSEKKKTKKGEETRGEIPAKMFSHLWRMRRAFERGRPYTNIPSKYLRVDTNTANAVALEIERELSSREEACSRIGDRLELSPVTAKDIFFRKRHPINKERYEEVLSLLKEMKARDYVLEEDIIRELELVGGDVLWGDYIKEKQPDMIEIKGKRFFPKNSVNNFLRYFDLIVEYRIKKEGEYIPLTKVREIVLGCGRGFTLTEFHELLEKNRISYKEDQSGKKKYNIRDVLNAFPKKENR